METAKLKKFAQAARTNLRKQVETKLTHVLGIGSAARRENTQAVTQLEKQIQETSREQVIDKVAYTWFNRFCALRFMDVNGYTRIRVVSPAEESQFQPEILAEAKMGHIDEDRVPERSRQQIIALINGSAPSHDPQQEAYRLLLVAECNSFHQAMPYLFERIAGYTELLMPDDLLSANSILTATREAMTPDACQDVEVIGWLYQFYISEKKAQVFDGLKKNVRITPENIPAATQLFTPHWIVRYLVENSLGRLWMLNHPKSSLAEQMDYYIKSDQLETGFLKIDKPEDIKICDPACGSGHMLTYAFDLLYAIYEEAGTDPSEISEKILTYNLYGIELDERAGELAAFALTMKARAKQRRFFNKSIKPNICVLEKIEFSNDELDEYMAAVGRDLFTLDLRATLKQFEEADNFGSLIRPKLTSVQNVLPLLEAKDLGGNLFLKDTHDKVVKVLRMVDALSPRYQVVIANPPYAGSKGLNESLNNWLETQYPTSKADLMSCFMERAMYLCRQGGFWGMITLQSWMFLDAFHELRLMLIKKVNVRSLLHLGRGIFGSDFGSVAFVINNDAPVEFSLGTYRRLFDKFSLVRTNSQLEQLFLTRSFGFYLARQDLFLKAPGSPFCYWLNEKSVNAFSVGTKLANFAPARQGLKTGNNEKFLRFWHEVAIDRSCLNAEDGGASAGHFRWFPCSKGGAFRRWYGNNNYLLNWERDGEEIRNYRDENGRQLSRPQNIQYFFLGGVTWSSLTIGAFSARLLPSHFAFESKGSAAPITDEYTRKLVLCFLNSRVVDSLLSAISPTVDYGEGAIGKLPLLTEVQSCGIAIDQLIANSKSDWDSYETSWDFATLPLLQYGRNQSTLKTSYQHLRAHWQQMRSEMQRLEEQNNRIFIEAYGLQDELTSEVPLKEITLTCNPHYRYGGDKNEEELETLLLADTMREFLSYAVGCMFGRYSLDKPGLVLANQGETLADFLRQIPEPSFMPDEDNVIPLLNGEWFADDVTERFRQFLRVTFGEMHYEENLSYIEAALGKDIRKYFLKDFYNDHVKRYRKCPTYWMFSSPKGTFNALIYLHRYRPDTVSVVLRYLRDFRKKLVARLDYLQKVIISTSASQGDKTKANKEVETIKQQQLELDDYERDTLYPLATEQVQLDLNDGVKVNYLTLGSALKKIAGLEAKED